MITVQTEQLAARAARVARTHDALAALGGRLRGLRDAGDDTEMAAAPAAPVDAWTRELTLMGEAVDGVALALLAAVGCYVAADQLPAPGGR